MTKPTTTRRTANFETRLRAAARMTNDDIRPGCTPDTLNQDNALRSAVCCRTDAIVLMHNEGSEPVFHTLACSKKWCPDCVRAWSEDLTLRLLPEVERFDPRHLRHLVLTIPSAQDGELGSALRALADSFREWRNQGRRDAHGGYWQTVDGHVWKIEIEKKGTAPWHPHIHVLLHCPDGFDFRGHSPARDAWVRITAGHEWPASRWAQYVTRPTSAQGVGREVAKYAAKPLQMDKLNVHDLMEIARSTHRMRWTGGSGTIQPRGKPRGGSDGEWNFLGRLSTIVEKAKNGDTQALQALRAWQKQAAKNPLVRARIPEWVNEL